MSEPSLDAIRRSDDFIDALAAGRPATPQDQSDAALAALLGGWRDETRWPPSTGLVSEPQAIAALKAGLAEKRAARRDPLANFEDWSTTKRNRRGLSVVGVAAAAVLCIGGFGAVVAGAGPGDALYGLRTMLFGASKQVREDQVGLAARTELDQVQQLISQGDWEKAQSKLVAVSSQVDSIDDVGQKQKLVEQFNDLSAKVVERDPEATAPPGITYTVPPSSTELVPTVAPTSVPSAPSLTDATTSGGSESSEDSGTTSSEPGSSSDTSASDASPASETAAATSTAPTSASASASAQTTTPTSGTPTTTTPTIAPKSSSVAPTTTVGPSQTTAPAQTATAQTTAAPANQTTAAPANQTTAAPANQTTAAQATSEAPPLITTTVVIPVPVG